MRSSPTSTYAALYGALLAPLKTCSCGVIYTHPTRDTCSRCSGWACACGKSKTPEQATCNARACVRRHKVGQREGVTTTIAARVPVAAPAVSSNVATAAALSEPVAHPYPWLVKGGAK